MTLNRTPEGQLILGHVSHSQLSMWLRCPRQWEFRYVMGFREPPSGAQIEGGSYHKTLEINFKQKVDSHQDLPLDQCLDAYSDEWDARISGEEDVDWGEKEPGAYKDEGVSLVTEYMASTAFYVQPVIVELRLESKLAGTKFVCVPDMVDSNKIVIDHKTAARAYTQADVDYDIQATAEAFALGKPIDFQNHVAVKTKKPKIQIIKSYRTQADIDWWSRMARDIIAQMQSGVAPPRPVDAFGKAGFWCSARFCGYFGACRR